MGLKKVERTVPVTEGPLDFIRGASKATGQKMAQGAKQVGQRIAQSAPVQAGREVVQAGRTASAVADLQRLVLQFAEMLKTYDQLNPRQQAEPQQAAQPQQAQPQTEGQLTLSAFLEQTHGSEITEGVWDFVKGAGAAVGGKIRDRINKYADQPSVLKDIYAAGKQASQQGDERSRERKFDEHSKKCSEVRTQICKMITQLGAQGASAFEQALQQLDVKTRTRIKWIIKTHIGGRGEV